jgi:type I restriction enzyme S subunit
MSASSVLIRSDKLSPLRGKSGFKKSAVGVIPENWNVWRIGEVMRLINGRAFKPRDWKTYGIPIIRIQNLNDPNAEFNYYQGQVDPRNAVLAGDLLFAWAGTTGTSFGARIWNGPAGVLNQHIFKVIPDKTRLTTEFGRLALQRVQEDIEKKAHGFKASFVHVRRSDLVDIALPVPPKREQDAIAAALADVDELIRALDDLIAKKRAIRLAVSQHLLTGRIRLHGFKENWKTRRIAEIAVPRADRNICGAELPVLTCSKHLGFVHSLEYFKNQIFSRDLRGYKIIRRGELGYPANHVEEGSMGLQDMYDDALVSPIYVVFAPREGVNGTFLHRLLKLDSYRQQFAAATNASVDRRGSLRWPAFSEMAITLPPTDEQDAIAGVLRDFETEIATVERQLQKTKAIKQGMMYELLTGGTRLI